MVSPERWHAAPSALQQCSWRSPKHTAFRHRREHSAQRDSASFPRRPSWRRIGGHYNAGGSDTRWAIGMGTRIHAPARRLAGRDRLIDAGWKPVAATLGDWKPVDKSTISVRVLLGASQASRVMVRAILQPPSRCSHRARALEFSDDSAPYVLFSIARRKLTTASREPDPALSHLARLAYRSDACHRLDAHQRRPATLTTAPPSRNGGRKPANSSAKAWWRTANPPAPTRSVKPCAARSRDRVLASWLSGRGRARQLHQSKPICGAHRRQPIDLAMAGQASDLSRPPTAVIVRRARARSQRIVVRMRNSVSLIWRDL